MKTGLTITQAAERYAITAATIYNFIKAGKVETQRHPELGTVVSKEGLESVLYGLCPVCGRGFKKGNQRQRFCSQACRQKENRSKR